MIIFIICFVLNCVSFVKMESVAIILSLLETILPPEISNVVAKYHVPLISDKFSQELVKELVEFKKRLANSANSTKHVYFNIEIFKRDMSMVFRMGGRRHTTAVWKTGLVTDDLDDVEKYIREFYDGLTIT